MHLKTSVAVSWVSPGTDADSGNSQGHNGLTGRLVDELMFANLDCAVMSGAGYLTCWWPSSDSFFSLFPHLTMPPM